jgi:hypothetical protein
MVRRWNEVLQCHIARPAVLIYNHAPPGFPSLEVTPAYCSTVILSLRFVNPGGGVALFMCLTRVVIYHGYFFSPGIFPLYLRPFSEYQQPYLVIQKTLYFCASQLLRLRLY